MYVATRIHINALNIIHYYAIYHNAANLEKMFIILIIKIYKTYKCYDICLKYVYIL